MSCAWLALGILFPLVPPAIALACRKHKVQVTLWPVAFMVQHHRSSWLAHTLLVCPQDQIACPDPLPSCLACCVSLQNLGAGTSGLKATSPHERAFLAFKQRTTNLSSGAGHVGLLTAVEALDKSVALPVQQALNCKRMRHCCETQVLLQQQPDGGELHPKHTLPCDISCCSRPC